jgi:hypothetical protein
MSGTEKADGFPSNILLINPQNGFEKAMPLKMMNNRLIGHRCGHVSTGRGKQRKTLKKALELARFPDGAAQGINVAAQCRLRPKSTGTSHE